MNKHTFDSIWIFNRIRCLLNPNFNFIRDSLNGKNELVILIDNHEPHGFHYHNRLPVEHDSRKEINAKNWQEAWNHFSQILREMFYEF